MRRIRHLSHTKLKMSEDKDELVEGLMYCSLGRGLHFDYIIRTRILGEFWRAHEM